MEEKTYFGKRELYAVILLAIISFFLFADQNLMAPNLTQIGNEFGFTPEERDVKLGGNISLIFWVLGGMITLGIGYFADLISRKKLFIWVIILGEIPCLLTGFAQNYDQLFWLRALTGIAIGGALPLTYSFIGDYFSNKNRAAAAGYIGLAQGLGIAIGQLLAGAVGPTMGWRIPFIIVAIPNFFLILLFLSQVYLTQPGGTSDFLLRSVIATTAPL
jgi:MFS family permease